MCLCPQRTYILVKIQGSKEAIKYCMDHPDCHSPATLRWLPVTYRRKSILSMIYTTEYSFTNFLTNSSIPRNPKFQPSQNCLPNITYWFTFPCFFSFFKYWRLNPQPHAYKVFKVSMLPQSYTPSPHLHAFTHMVLFRIWVLFSLQIPFKFYL